MEKWPFVAALLSNRCWLRDALSGVKLHLVFARLQLACNFCTRWAPSITGRR